LPVASAVKWPLRLLFERAVSQGEIDPARPIRVGPADAPGGTGVLERLPLPREVTLADAAELMVMVSDNLGCNLVIDALGGRERVDARLRDALGDDVRLCDRARFDPREDVPSMGEASADGLLRFLARLVEDDDPSVRATRAAGRRTQDRSMLPRYLPNPLLDGEGPEVAHKGGLMPGVRADAGLLRADGRTLAMAAISYDVDDGGFGYDNRAERRIGRIAALLAHLRLGTRLAPGVLDGA
jgi:beta-lactamase class A